MFAAAQSVHEVFDQIEVRSGVERRAQNVREVENPFLPAPEPADAERAFVSVDFAAGQADMRFALVAQREGVY